ncbi:DUF350 domain-containing protein [Iodidimonas muriae]|uniref:DUF350 domain-containing protein n=1 Tax=Iodidimonas muriae TaxID=261467 RepID=A0ABQ2L953_9PROT|nr:DUF350 domain-containing protein [Iodidimonas muriae]GER05925.1 DUF350 domain-containing protein [Kordiimonadales bacterium JCM 17843]GGO07459.1 DUF350 domain-containing protein [Iodidimonas muriae]
MPMVIDSLIAGLPDFLAQSATCFAVLVLGLVIYMWMTPHKEMALIRDGNIAASLSLGGAILGLSLPLAFTLAGSVSVVDMAVWGVVTLVLQLLAFRVMDLVLKDLSARIERGEMAAAILLVSAKLATAMVNAAAISV